MPTIDSDAHVVETEHTWDFMEPADQKYRPLIVKPRGEGGAEYWFIDGKIRGLVRIVMTAKEMDEVADRTGRVMMTPRETREMENIPARLRHMDEWESTFRCFIQPSSSSRSLRNLTGRSLFARAIIAGSPTFTGKVRGGSDGSVSCRCSI